LTDAAIKESDVGNTRVVKARDDGINFGAEVAEYEFTGSVVFSRDDGINNVINLACTKSGSVVEVVSRDDKSGSQLIDRMVQHTG